MKRRRPLTRPPPRPRQGACVISQKLSPSRGPVLNYLERTFSPVLPMGLRSQVRSHHRDTGLTNFKLDENLGPSVGEVFGRWGHDGRMAREQELSGSTDAQVLDTAVSEGRILVNHGPRFWERPGLRGKSNVGHCNPEPTWQSLEEPVTGFRRSAGAHCA